MNIQDDPMEYTRSWLEQGMKAQQKGGLDVAISGQTGHTIRQETRVTRVRTVLPIAPDHWLYKKESEDILARLFVSYSFPWWES